jgi:hypothetical protein
VAGSAVKTVANVGGGSTPSLVRVTVPVSIAAGTASAHDVVSIGASTLSLASTTSAGAFADFAGGTLVNRGTLSVHAGKVFASSYVQVTGGRLAVALTGTGHGLLQVSGSASLHGTLALHNSYTPALGAAVTVLSAHTLTDSLSCVTTSGTASTAGHWSDTHSAARITLAWRGGSSPC